MATPSNTRPDLEDDLNVAESHAALNSRATVREKKLHENGNEPIPLWIVLLGGLVTLVGGSVLGAGGNLFSYNELVKEDYVQLPQPPIAGGESVPVPIGDHLIAEGGKIYSKCVGCHQNDGLGQAGNFPPLAGSEWVTGDTEALSAIILHGLNGPIEVKGVTWNGNMPSQADGMGPKELAAVMTYIRKSWGNNASLVTPEMAENGLAIYKADGPGQITAAKLKTDHAKMLEGAEMDPSTLIDPDTWLPVEGQ